MINHVWSVVCESASIDNKSNRVSLFNTIETLITDVSPSEEKPFLFSCELISLWYFDGEGETRNGTMRLLFESPNGKQLGDLTVPIDFSTSDFHRTRLFMKSIPILQPGMSFFLIDYKLGDSDDWKFGAKIPVKLVLSKQLKENI